MSSLSKSFRLSSTLKIGEEAMEITKNQGIGSILGSDISDERSTKSSSSLRRTLSADMSSTKWLTQNGFFSPMKKIASSEEFSICSITDSSSSSEDEEDDTETELRSQFDIWSSIQEEANKKKQQQLDEEKPGGQFDIWSSIIQQKSQEITNDNKPLPPPYIHPLVKRSASSLSEKSLEICTESLGSETGSDGFSSYPASESGDVTEDDKETEPPEQQQTERVERCFENFEQVFVPKYNYAAAVKKSPTQRSFPPPIPSRGDGASIIRMKSRRDNGRLVVEAISVPSTNNFLAQRQNGRLVLTFVNSTTLSTENILKIEQENEMKEAEEEEEEEVLDEEFESFGDDDDGDNGSDESEEEEGDESEMRGGVKVATFVMEQAPKLSSNRVINVHRLTLMGLASRNPTWPKKLFNEVDVEEEDSKPAAIVAKSLPPMARLIPTSPASASTAAVTVTAAATGGGGRASFNTYEYYWRPKPMTTQSKCSNKQLILSNNSNSMDNNNNNNNNNQEQQQLLVLRGNKGDYLVPLVKSCKEPRRSLLFWEPHCIATS